MQYFAAIFGCILFGFLPSIGSITTTHHDKPHEVHSAAVATETNEQPNNNLNVTLPASERHKRLLPYMNFYLQQAFNQPNAQRHQQQQQQLKRYRIVVPKQAYQHPFQQRYNELTGLNYNAQRITPFTESNALPGPFIPMKTNQDNEYVRQPNFSDIYDKLSQLKQQQQRQYNQPYKQTADIGKSLIRYVLQDPQRIIQKPVIQTYTPTQVDIPPQQPPPPPPQQQQYQQVYEINPQYNRRPIEFPPQDQDDEKQSYRQELVKPIIIIGQKFPYRDVEKQKMFEEQLRIYEDQQKIYLDQQRMIENDRKYKQQYQIVPNLQSYKYDSVDNQQPNYQQVVTIQKIEQPTYQQSIPPPYNPEYKTIVDPPPIPNPVSTQTPYYAPPTPQIPDPQNNLGQILRKLQESNALPQTLTPDNIDNSIKTLVRILSALKKHQRLSKKPIVVPDLPTGEGNDEENETDGGLGEPSVDNVPGTVVQNYPADTPEGGTPGKAGIDYPALSSIPQTSFNCKTQRYKGFFGDPDTNCQVWHYCDFNGGQASFLCPNGTIFSQVALTCDWWYNVKCATTPQLYVLNERLYKYILPFSPKFPEDYSGPLVDRYIALKFQEMEEKMLSSQKKPKMNDDKEEMAKPEVDDADQLQMQNEESRIRHESDETEEQSSETSKTMEDIQN